MTAPGPAKEPRAGADEATSAFYDRHAARLAEGGEPRRSAMLPFVVSDLPPGASVLDVGCGGGRDVAALLGHGFEAFGVEPNEAMRTRAHATHPALAGRIREGALPALGRPFHDLHAPGFDAVVCSAVLMHLHPAVLASALLELAAQLRTAAEPAGEPRLFLSVPQMDGTRLSAGRDAEGRRFFNHAPSSIERALQPAGLVLHRAHTSDAVLQSTGTLWHTLVFRQGAAARDMQWPDTAGAVGRG